MIDCLSLSHCLQVRNIYETRVGKFVAPAVETLDPRTRQLSDLPAWMDQQLDEFRGKRVLMVSRHVSGI